MLLPLLNLSAQIKPLGIGDVVPDIQLNNVINYPVSQIQLSSFKNKHIILDFWASWCSSCFRHFPQLDSLQQQYPGQLQVLLVNTKTTGDDEQKITTAYARIRSGGSNFNLPTLAADTIISRLFPHYILPHYVWIDNQHIVKAITDAEALTPGNIEMFLQNKTFVVNTKNDLSDTLPVARTVKGKVIDAFGNTALPNAAIKLLRSGTIILSDANGRFSITATTGDTIQFSYTGFNTVAKPVKNIAADAVLNIIMQPKASQLGDVVVYTGYQSLPKERATGSFEHLNNALLNQQVSTNITDRLEAITNGLLLDRKTNLTPGFVIRGISTILGAKGPLIVVDDFPYDGDITNINPNDVENITVLKDAAAASLWGAKAGNGVIVITTKKGKFNQNISTEFNINMSFTGKPDLGYIKQMNSSDFIDMEQMLYSKGYYNAQLSSTSRPPVSPLVELLVAKANGSIAPADADAKINAMRSMDVRNDFNKYMYNNALNKQYAVTVKGGSYNHAWLLSAGRDENTDALSSIYNRLNLRSENTIRIHKDIDIEAGVYFTETKSTAGKPGYGSITPTGGSLAAIPPYTRLADSAGNALAVMKEYRQTYKDTAGAGKLLNWNYYPLNDYKYVHNTSTVQDITAHIGIRYRLTGGVEFLLKYQYEQQQNSGNILYDTAAYYTRSYINIYSQLNRSTGTMTYIVPKGSIVDYAYTNLQAQNFRAQLNFNRTWGNHSIAMLGGSEIKDNITTINSYRNYGYNTDIMTTVNVDYANTYPNFVTGNKTQIINNNSNAQVINRFVSFFANSSYTYKERYTFSASGRRDASNLFGVNTNNKWNPLWSAGAAWDIWKEHFWQSAHLPYGRLRVTYGYAGNTNPNVAAVTTLQYSFTSPYTQLPTAIIGNNANPDLRWEKTATLNIGLDLKLLHNRISITADYFNKKMTDLFTFYPVDNTVGFSNITKNAANASGNGIDLDITVINTKGKINWTTQLNASYYKDKVTQYFLSSTQGSNFVGSTQPPVTGMIGRPVYSMLAYRWGGLDPQTGDPQGYLSGTLSKDYSNITGKGTQLTDLVYKGTIYPLFYGSMGNTISWKQLDLTIRILYKLGYYFRRSSINYNALYSTYTGHSDYTLRWQQPGDEQKTNVPSLVYPAITARDNFYTGSEATVEKGDNIRLQYINIAYNINKTKIKNLPFKTMQLYLNCSNIGILWRANHLNIDPDFRDGSIPPSPTTAIGCRVQF